MSAPDPQSSPEQIAYEDIQEERASSATPSQVAPDHAAAAAGHAEPEQHDPYAALRIGSYRLYAISFILAIIGGQIQSVAIAWEVYQKHKSVLHLGFIGGIQVIPVLLLALPAGQLVDIVSRKRVLIITQLLLAIWGLALAGLSFFFHEWSGFLPAAFGILLINAITLTFARPARSALLPQLIPLEIFSNAATWNSSMFEVSSMIGPALGGLIVAMNVPLAYLANALLLVGCILLTVKLPDKPIERSGERPGFASLVAGVRFVWRTRLLLATLSLDLFAVLLGGAIYLLPKFADLLQAGSVGYGLLRAAPSIGAVAMALVLAHRPPMKRAGSALLLSVAGFGLATIVFGLSKNFWLSFAMLILTGAFDNISVVIRHTLVQLLTPDSMRGRVSAVNQIFIGSSNELGGLESGLTAHWWGPVPSVLVGGIGTVLVVLGINAVFPQVRRFGSLKDARPEESKPPLGAPPHPAQ